MTDPPSAEPPGRRGIAWISGPSVLGGAVLGLAVNWISDAYPGAGPTAIAATLLLVLVSALTLRRLDPRAPIHRMIRRSGLALAAVTAAASLAVPIKWAQWLVLIAAAAALISCLTPLTVPDITGRLACAGSIGFGVALIGAGLGVVSDGRLLPGVAFIGGGVAVAVAGLSFVLDSRLLPGVAFIGCGVAGAVVGLSVVLDSRLLLGMAGIGGGVAVAVAGLSSVLDSRLLLGMAFIGCGVAVAVVGLSFVLDSRLLLGMAGIGCGVAVAVVGLSSVLDSRLLLGMAGIGCGVAVAVVGLSAVLDSRLLLGVAMISVGVAMIGVGTRELAPMTADLRARVRRLVTAPSEEPAHRADAAEAAPLPPGTAHDGSPAADTVGRPPHD